MSALGRPKNAARFDSNFADLITALFVDYLKVLIFARSENVYGHDY